MSFPFHEVEGQSRPHIYPANEQGPQKPSESPFAETLFLGCAFLAALALSLLRDKHRGHFVREPSESQQVNRCSNHGVSAGAEKKDTQEVIKRTPSQTRKLPQAML